LDRGEEVVHPSCEENVALRRTEAHGKGELRGTGISGLVLSVLRKRKNIIQGDDYLRNSED